MLDKERQRDLAERAAGAWQCLVQLCIDEEASFLVLAGDIFHEAAAGVRVQLLFQDGLQRLVDSGVSVFICHGNHDPLGKDFRPIGELPPSAVRFEPGEPQYHPVTLRNSRDRVLVGGVSFGAQRERENLASRFREIERRPDAAPRVAVLHANVGSSPGHGEYAPCTWDDLDTESVDYWALGHIHKRGIRRLSSGARAAYCGNLQGRNFKPSECEPKGALVVPIEDGRIGEPGFQPCDQVRFVRSSLQVNPDDDILTLHERIAKEASLLGDRHLGLPVAWCLELTGTNTDVASQPNKIVASDLHFDLADDLSDRLNGGGLCRVAFSVRPDVREEILAGDDLRAHVLKALNEFWPVREVDDAMTQELTKMLRDGLPETLKREWDEMLDESPESMGEVKALAGQLLLDAFSEARGDAQ